MNDYHDNIDDIPDDEEELDADNSVSSQSQSASQQSLTPEIFSIQIFCILEILEMILFCVRLQTSAERAVHRRYEVFDKESANARIIFFVFFSVGQRVAACPGGFVLGMSLSCSPHWKW